MSDELINGLINNFKKQTKISKKPYNESDFNKIIKDAIPVQFKSVTKKTYLEALSDFTYHRSTLFSLENTDSIKSSDIVDYITKNINHFNSHKFKPKFDLAFECNNDSICLIELKYIRSNIYYNNWFKRILRSQYVRDYYFTASDTVYFTDINEGKLTADIFRLSNATLTTNSSYSCLHKYLFIAVDCAKHGCIGDKLSSLMRFIVKNKSSKLITRANTELKGIGAIDILKPLDVWIINDADSFGISQIANIKLPCTGNIHLHIISVN